MHFFFGCSSSKNFSNFTNPFNLNTCVTLVGETKIWHKGKHAKKKEKGHLPSSWQRVGKIKSETFRNRMGLRYTTLLGRTSREEICRECTVKPVHWSVYLTEPNSSPIKYEVVLGAVLCSIQYLHIHPGQKNHVCETILKYAYQLNCFIFFFAKNRIFNLFKSWKPTRIGRVIPRVM